MVQSHIVRKAFDGNSFSSDGIIVSFPIEWGGKIVIVGVEVVYAPIDYKFMLVHIWIHAMMTRVYSESQVIQFPHWGRLT